MNNEKTILILLTSDRNSILNRMQKLLSGPKYHIVCMEVGISTVLKILKSNFDIIIFDYDKFIIYSLRILEIICMICPDTPKIALYKQLSSEEIQRILQMGVSYCAVKPTELMEIVSLVKAHRITNSNYSKRPNSLTI